NSRVHGFPSAPGLGNAAMEASDLSRSTHRLATSPTPRLGPDRLSRSTDGDGSSPHLLHPIQCRFRRNMPTDFGTTLLNIKPFQWDYWRRRCNGACQKLAVETSPFRKHLLATRRVFGNKHLADGPLPRIPASTMKKDVNTVGRIDRILSSS